VPISQNRAAHVDACALEANRVLFEKISRYARSVGANDLRRRDVTNGRPLSILGGTWNWPGAQGCSERNARERASIAISLPSSFQGLDTVPPKLADVR
jgi:hypothetical protein